MPAIIGTGSSVPWETFGADFIRLFSALNGLGKITSTATGPLRKYCREIEHTIRNVSSETIRADFGALFSALNGLGKMYLRCPGGAMD